MSIKTALLFIKCNSLSADISFQSLLLFRNTTGLPTRPAAGWRDPVLFFHKEAEKNQYAAKDEKQQVQGHCYKVVESGLNLFQGYALNPAHIVRTRHVGDGKVFPVSVLPIIMDSA